MADSLVSGLRSAVLWPVAGFLVVGLSLTGVGTQGHSADFEPRSCVREQLSREEYYRLDVRTEGAGMPIRSSRFLDRDINILYWDMESSRSCVRKNDYRPITETFFDYNLRKLLARSSSEVAARFPDVLILDNCTPCGRLDNMHVLASRELQSVYGGNCEFIPRNEYRRHSGGTCLFWSSKVQMVSLSDKETPKSNDRTVDWVPILPTSHEREQYRTDWIRRLAKKKLETDGLLLNRFAPRIFQTSTGFRFHVIPARINRLIGSPLDNVERETTVYSLISRFKMWSPSDSEPESLVHNQIGRLIAEYRSYVAKVRGARPGRNVPILLLGNLQVPRQLCGVLGGLQKLQVMEALRKTSLNALPSDCDWPTSSTAETDLPRASGRGLQMQLQHSYVEILPGPSSDGPTLRSEVLPLSGTNIYPHSISISY